MSLFLSCALIVKRMCFLSCLLSVGDSAEAILVQINAVKSAIHKVGELVILEDIREKLSGSGADSAQIEEALTDIKRFSGLS